MSKRLLWRFYLAIRVLIVIGIILYFVHAAYTPKTLSPSSNTTPDASYAYADYNFDGVQDRALQTDCGATGNCSYLIQLYDPSTKSFVTPSDYDSGTEYPDGKIDDGHFFAINPVVNPQEKLVCEFANSSVADFIFRVYKYSKGYFYPVQQISHEYNSEKDTIAVKVSTFVGNTPKQQSISYLPSTTISNIPDCTLK